MLWLLLEVLLVAQLLELGRPDQDLVGRRIRRVLREHAHPVLVQHGGDQPRFPAGHAGRRGQSIRLQPGLPALVPSRLLVLEHADDGDEQGTPNSLKVSFA